MSDPVEIVRKIVEQRRTEQAKAEAAAGVWQAKLPAIEGYVKEVVAPLEGAGVNMVVGVRGGTLGVQFHKRHLRMVQDSPNSKRWVFETGALFKAAVNPDDGMVHYCAWPFRDEEKHYDPKPGQVLGDPHTLTKEVVGAAVAAFIQWAAVGDGRGSRRLQISDGQQPPPEDE
jgi:hypothetical protein